jgi:hypothetical protein
MFNDGRRRHVCTTGTSYVCSSGLGSCHARSSLALPATGRTDKAIPSIAGKTTHLPEAPVLLHMADCRSALSHTSVLLLLCFLLPLFLPHPMFFLRGVAPKKSRSTCRWTNLWHGRLALASNFSLNCQAKFNCAFKPDSRLTITTNFALHGGKYCSLRRTTNSPQVDCCHRRPWRLDDVFLWGKSR